MQLTMQLAGNKAKGFTLIEIIIALAIVAVAVLALGKSMSQNVLLTSEQSRRLIAYWVASNELATYRFEQGLSNSTPASISKTITMGGGTWLATIDIKESEGSESTGDEVSGFTKANTSIATISVFDQNTEEPAPLVQLKTIFY